jgi:hypothetical protein
MRSSRLISLLLAALAAGLIACTELDPEDIDGAPSPTSADASPNQGETVIPTPEPTLTPTATPGDDDAGPTAPADPEDLEGALAAAARVLGVPYGADCTDDGDCVREMPTGETSTAGPITQLAYMSADGGGAVIFVARDGAGVWQYWQITQFGVYFLVDVPGELRACPDSASLAVRSSPSSTADIAGELPHGATAVADSFVLSQPGSLDEPGTGWYRVTDPVDGWVPASDTADAELGDCELRDQFEGGSGSVG